MRDMHLFSPFQKISMAILTLFWLTAMSGQAPAQETEPNVLSTTPNQDLEDANFESALNSVLAYRKAEGLFKEIANLEWSYENVVKYDEVVKIAEGIKRNRLAAPDLAIKAQYLIFGSYHNQAKYPEKYKAFEECAELVSRYHGEEEAGKVIKEEADSNFYSKEYDCAIGYYRMIVDKNLKTSIREPAQFSLGRCYEILMDYDKAIETYKGLVQEKSKSVWRQLACERLADVCSFNGDFDKAIALTRQLMTDFPDSKRLDYARYNIGYYHYRKKDYELAVKEFEDLIKEYPESYYTGWAKKHIKEIEAEKSGLVKRN